MGDKYKEYCLYCKEVIEKDIEKPLSFEEWLKKREEHKK